MLLDALSASVSKTRENASALQAMLKLLQKAGAPAASLYEVQELLAHAYVQGGQLQQAADTYQLLSQAEPENPLHEQNYRQIMGRMGKDSVTRELSAEEGEKALMVEALMGDDFEAPPVFAQEYSRDLAEEIDSALTDSELFASYNVPEKALAPLEEVLPKAPKDIRLRQRLASIYVRLERFADAANSCTALAEVHEAAGFGEQAAQFREMAAKYNEQAAGERATAPVVDINAVPVESPPKQIKASEEQPTFEASSITEPLPTGPVPAALSAEPSIAEFDLSAVSPDPLPEEPAAPASPVAAADNVSEWEDMLTVESPPAPGAQGGEVQEVSAEGTPGEILEEARF